MSKTNFYSPIGLVRLLKQVSPRHPYRVIQISADDSKDCHQHSFVKEFLKSSHDILEPEKSASIMHSETPTRKTKKSKISSASSSSVFHVKPKIQVCDQRAKRRKALRQHSHSCIFRIKLSNYSHP